MKTPTFFVIAITLLLQIIIAIGNWHLYIRVENLEFKNELANQMLHFQKTNFLVTNIYFPVTNAP